MAYQFMQRNKGEYAVKEMAGLLGVKPGAYYKWAREGVSDRRRKADEVLLDFIRKIQEDHCGRYGSPRVRAELRNKYGICASRKKVAQMMRENGLNARRKKKSVKTTDSKHDLPVCGNLLDRDFQAGKPGQKWVSDITYLRTVFGWIYLTVVIDLFDRKAVGWALSANMEALNTTVPALRMAVKNRPPEDGLLFHSDRGVQYCAQVFRDALRELCPSARQSMSRKGNCWDNACAESFFKTLKCEMDTLDGRHSREDVRQSVFMYIESYYNRVRLHSALDYVAPNAYDVNEVA